MHGVDIAIVDACDSNVRFLFARVLCCSVVVSGQPNKRGANDTETIGALASTARCYRVVFAAAKNQSGGTPRPDVAFRSHTQKQACRTGARKSCARELARLVIFAAKRGGSMNSGYRRLAFYVTTMKKTAVAGAVAAALLAPLGSPIEAQQPGAEAGLEEIIVSARRREESLQTVPLAITAFTGESLEARGVDMVGNMNAMAPNLSVQGQAGPHQRVGSLVPRARSTRSRRLRRWHRPDERHRAFHDGRRRSRTDRSAARSTGHAVRQLGAWRCHPVCDAPPRR